MYNYWFVCRRNAASEFVSFVRFTIVFMEFCCVSVCWRAYRRNKKDNSEKKSVLYVGFQLKQTRVTIQLILTVRLIITVELPNYQQKRVGKVVRNKRRSMSSAHFLCRIVCKWECVSE